MGNIDRFLAKKNEVERLESQVTKVLGDDDRSNDKHNIRASFLRLDSGNWNDMIIGVHASHGYYGSSSGYSDTSDILGKYLCMAINKDIRNLVLNAVAIAKDDLEKERLTAIEEAQSVLLEIK